MKNQRSTFAAVLLVALMVAGVLWGSAATQSGVERAVRQNFVSAGLLSQLQVEGEKMRRYEKEMFIYVADSAKRNGYVKEFETAYTKMLGQLDAMLRPSSPYFNDTERAEVMRWKQAALFYAGEFNGLSVKAGSLQVATLNADQRAALTVEYNNAIKAGKDRFRDLLGGTEKMRLAKEEAAQQIAAEIDSTFLRLRYGVLAGGLIVIALMLLMLRGGRPMAAGLQPAPAVRQR
jgi:hypothetical protein